MNFKRLLLLITCISPFAMASNMAEHISKETQNKISAHLKKAEQRHGIFGQSLAILKNGQLVYLGATGQANIEFKIPATPDTVYSIYSVTKLFVSTRLLQLVEQGKLSLTDTLGQHFPDAPKNWHKVTILQMLSHVSGIPEYSQETMTHITGQEAILDVAELPMEFETGSKSSYNQTNFYYIQKLIEKFDRKSFEQTIYDQAITPFKLSNTSFGGEFDIIDGRATRYEGTSRGHKRVMRNDPPEYYYAANGMNSTVNDIATWFQALLQEKLVSSNSLKQAWQPISLNNGKNARHSHGWEITKMNGFTAVGHYGANFVNVRHFFKDDLKNNTVTVIHLTNGRSKRFNPLDFSYTLASEILNEMKTPIRSLKEDMLLAIEDNSLRQAKAIYSQFKENHPELATKTEDTLNRLGYATMTTLGAEQAIVIFKLNTQEYPHSANTFDSLAEAYLEIGDKKNAIYNYQQALKLDKKNKRIKNILKELQ